MTPPHPPVTLDCFARASRTENSVDSVIETLRGYEKRGVIDEVTIECWPEEIPLAGATGEEVFLDRYDQLQTWADDSGVTLEPAFTRRERTTLASDGSETVLVIPVLFLAVHVDEELVNVAPHCTETSAYTVQDALADIESRPRASPEDASEFPPDHPVRSAIDEISDDSPRSTENEEITSQ